MGSGAGQDASGNMKMPSAGRKFLMAAATGGMDEAGIARDIVTSMKGMTAGMSH